MLCTPIVGDSSARHAVDTLSIVREGDLLSLREESDWPIPERDGEQAPTPGRDRVDINTTSGPELSDFLGLAPVDVRRVLALRDSLGFFSSFTELRHLGEDLYGRLRMLRRRIRFSRAPPMVAIRLRASLTQRSPEDQSWSSPWKTYLRASLAPARTFRVGFLGEKDAGEPYRYAFASAYLLVERLGMVERLVVGDYTLQAGQGLTLGRGRGFRRDFPVRQGTPLEPHTYADESGYFRGVALTSSMGWSRMRWTLFYSATRRAASLDSQSGVVELHESGLFRTAYERASYASVRETAFGSLLSISPQRNIELGLSFFRAKFLPEPLGEDRGGSAASRVEGVSLHWRFRFPGSSLEGEIARSSPGGLALASCWVIPAGSHAKLLLALRHYGAARGVGFSSAPGRSGICSNEQGGIFTAEFSPLGKLLLKTTLDIYRELWSTERTPMARYGGEASVKLSIPIATGALCALRMRLHGGTERIAANDDQGRRSWELVRRERNSLRLTLRRAAGKLMVSDSQIEMVEVIWQGRSTRERGWLLSQALTLHPTGGLMLVVRVAYARTASYASRLYLSEHDHNGSGGFVMLYGGAVRFYLFLRAELPGNLRLSAKYASSLVDPLRGSDIPPGELVASSLVSLQLEGTW